MLKFTQKSIEAISKAQEIVIDELFKNDVEKICLPNNILGLEYLKSIKNTNSSITPITVKRSSKYISSSKIRAFLRKNDISELKKLKSTIK